MGLFFSVCDFVTNPVCGFFCFGLVFNAAVELVRQELFPRGSPAVSRMSLISSGGGRLQPSDFQEASKISVYILV